MAVTKLHQGIEEVLVSFERDQSPDRADQPGRGRDSEGITNAPGVLDREKGLEINAIWDDRAPPVRPRPSAKTSPDGLGDGDRPRGKAGQEPVEYGIWSPEAQVPDHRPTDQSSDHAGVEHGPRAVRVQKGHTHVSNEAAEVHKAPEHSRARTTEAGQ